MKRALPEVLASQRKMLERRGEVGETSETMLSLWAKHLSKVEAQLRGSENVELLEIAYAGVVEDPRAEAERIRDFLAPLDVEKMAAAVDGSLYRNRS